MIKDNSLIKNYLSNNFDKAYKLNKSRYKLLFSIYKRLELFKTNIEKFIKEKIDVINRPEKDKEQLSKPKEEDEFYNFYFLIEETIERSFNENYEMINKILENIIKLKKSIEKYFEIYDDFNECEKIFTNKLIEIEEYKNNFFESAKKAENFTYDFFKKKLNNKNFGTAAFNQKEDLQANAKRKFESYKNIIKKGNQELEKFNEKQKKLFKAEKKLENIYNEMYIECIYRYYEHQLIINELTKKINGKLEDDEKKNKNDINALLKNYKEKKEIEFVQYKSQLEFKNYNDNLYSTARIIAINEIANTIGKYKEIEFKLESKKIEMSSEIKRITYSDEKINEKDFEKLLEYFKTDLGQDIFLNFLTGLRTKGKYKKSKIFIEIIGKSLSKILEYCEDKKDYEKANNCVILSQTFYYNDDLKNDKVYIFEFIKENKWLKTSEFWRQSINMLIKEQFEKINKVKSKDLGDILLSQLAPIINNMKDVNIDPRIIVKVTDEFLEKYNYIKDDIYQTLFALITNDIKEIEKLRKEYKEDPDIETKLCNNEIKKEKEKEKENDNKINENKDIKEKEKDIEKKEKDIDEKEKDIDEKVKDINEKGKDIEKKEKDIDEKGKDIDENKALKNENEKEKNVENKQDNINNEKDDK